MHYRLYKAEDFAALYAIEEACFALPDRFSRGYMRHLIRQANAATWIAGDEAGIRGFGIVEWKSGESGVTAYVETLEVLAEARGQGIGGELLRRMEGSAVEAGAARVDLHVEASNAAAIGLYERHGYRARGTHGDYYGPGRPALIYGKPMKPS